MTPSGTCESICENASCCGFSQPWSSCAGCEAPYLCRPSAECYELGSATTAATARHEHTPKTRKHEHAPRKKHEHTPKEVKKHSHAPEPRKQHSHTPEEAPALASDTAQCCAYLEEASQRIKRLEQQLADAQAKLDGDSAASMKTAAAMAAAGDGDDGRTSRSSRSEHDEL